MRIVETVPVALDGERLDRIVALVVDISRSLATGLIDAGGVMVDDQVAASGKVRLREGQTVVLDTDKIPEQARPAADPSVSIDVVHVDDDIIVINKPAGLVVHPAAGHATGTVVNGILAMWPEVSDVGQSQRPGIVHRLDAGTTGLMVVARTSLAYETLVEALSAHEVGREYMALAWGHFDSTSVVIDADIGRDLRDPLKMAVVRGGKWARTNVEVIDAFDSPAQLSLVRCLLETGRTHQIRVHLAAVGHPVVGDATYGGARSALVASRPMLHAIGLTLTHPRSGETMEFAAPVPADMSAVVAMCGHEQGTA